MNKKLVDIVAEVICDHEFGCAAGDWKRLLKRVERADDVATYSAQKVERLRATARAVLDTVGKTE